MSFDVSKFREALGGGARANLFRVTLLAPPTGVAGAEGFNEGSLFSVTCRSASLPASTLGLIEVPFNAGRRYKQGGERTYAEWTTTIINTEDFSIRKALEEWQKAIVFTRFDLDTVGNRDLYVGGAENTTASALLRSPGMFVDQLDDNGDPVVRFKLHHCWPSDISTIDLSYDTTDAIEEFSVTWTYDYYTQESV